MLPKKINELIYINFILTRPMLHFLFIQPCLIETKYIQQQKA